MTPVAYAAAMHVMRSARSIAFNARMVAPLLQTMRCATFSGLLSCPSLRTAWMLLLFKGTLKTFALRTLNIRVPWVQLPLLLKAAPINKYLSA